MGEIIVPVLGLLIAAGFYSMAGTLRIFEGFPMTSASYPRTLSIILMLCCAFLIIRFIVKHKKYIAAEKKLIFDPRIFLTLALLVLFYFGLEYIGYMPSAFLLVFSLALLLKEGKPRILDVCILPICLSVGLFFAFRFMGIYLPVGRLFRGLF